MEIGFHIRGIRAVRHCLRRDGARFAGAAVDEAQIEDRARFDGRAVCQEGCHVPVRADQHHAGIEVDALAIEVNLIAQSGVRHRPGLHSLAVGGEEIVRLFHPLSEAVGGIRGQSGEAGAVLPRFAAVHAVLRAGYLRQRDGGDGAVSNQGRGGHGLGSLGDGHLHLDPVRVQRIAVLRCQSEAHGIAASVHRRGGKFVGVPVGQGPGVGDVNGLHALQAGEQFGVGIGLIAAVVDHIAVREFNAQHIHHNGDRLNLLLRRVGEKLGFLRVRVAGVGLGGGERLDGKQGERHAQRQQQAHEGLPAHGFGSFHRKFSLSFDFGYKKSRNIVRHLLNPYEIVAVFGCILRMTSRSYIRRQLPSWSFR